MQKIAFIGKLGVADLTGLCADDYIGRNGHRGIPDVRDTSVFHRQFNFKHRGFAVFADGCILCHMLGIVDSGGYDFR